MRVKRQSESRLREQIMYNIERVRTEIGVRDFLRSHEATRVLMVTEEE